METSGCDGLPKVSPRWVLFRYQIDLPCAIPLLDALLPMDRLLHIVTNLEIHQAVDPITAGEPFDDVVPVLPYPPYQIAGYPHIQGSVALAGKYVDRRLLVHP